MKPRKSEDITQLLTAWSDGEDGALDKLTTLVYDELRRLAHSHISRERTGHTLQTTGLVNEAYLRISKQKQSSWENRTQFFGFAAKIMRHVLIDYAKTRKRQKRGSDINLVTLEGLNLVEPERGSELIALDEALKKLEIEFPRKARVTELRYFGGLSVDETAQLLNISSITVMRDWNVAKAWLYREMNNDA